ncbi:MAG: tryptophan synthase subunit alpha [Alphaproteobacteria bacterium RIFCSPHIGHO2_02_FULL_46_13]|nr:MAG: tryptophan synthase subunit alpha [Alphaproteobacteria bacterium RIFCSPHIGHO2_02_FULL_46_13]
MSRLADTFSRLKAKGRAALVSYVVAGDPNPELGQEILNALPDAGVDVIELGIPFTDPMADGPTIQAADIRALAAGMSVAKTLDMVRTFRQKNTTTPIVLMGYYNPVYIYGGARFAKDAAAAGVDGLLLVDLPPEEDGEIKGDLKAAGIDLIRLITPTSTGERLKKLVQDTSGFLYYVSIAGVTGTASIEMNSVAAKLKEIKAVSDLPVAVGFGIRTIEDAKAVASIAEGVVIGSAFVRIIEKTVENQIVSELSRQAKAYADALA